MIQEIKPIRKKVLEHIKQRSQKEVIISDKIADKLDPNYTINFFPSEEMRVNLYSEINRFKEKYPEHNYQEEERLHSTLVGLIPLNTDLEVLIEFVKKNIPKDFEVRYQGMDVTSKTANIMTFSQNLEVKRLRNLFSSTISDETLQYYDFYEDICWSTFLRYGSKPKQDFYKDILENLDKDFGIADGKIQILKNADLNLTGAEVVFEL